MGLRWAEIAAMTTTTALTLLLGQSPALAITPAPIDSSALPEGLPPAPPQPTEQRSLCFSAASAGDGPDVPLAQLSLGFESVWPITRGGGQRVAVIDTGVGRHPRLPTLEAGGDYVGTSDGTEDCDVHGTVVAGLIAAQPMAGSGFAGGAPDAQIIAIRQSSAAFSAAGSSQAPDVAENSPGYGDVNTMAAAIRHAADLGATVINISEVACKSASDGIDDRRLGAAVEYAAVVKDAVVVAAAGNVGSGGCKTQNPPPDPLRPGHDLWQSVTTIASPAWYDDFVLTVGSVDPNGSASTFSLGGPWVGVAAPGTGIVSLSPTEPGLTNGKNGSDGASEPFDGTSFAAPFVAATAALVRSRYPELNAAQVIRRIQATAHAPAQGWNPYLGYGVVDPLAAVTAEFPEVGPTIDHRSVAISPLPPIPAADTRARDTALIGAGAVAVVTVLAVLASVPIRRRMSERSAH
ncbi:membrane-anchored mycosin MYCP [Rhodococcus sp. 27YEA15]|uniref:type VII secretion-associated serine protease mycosin n=1 Tax=Rhodococcus sp. 27YEA15 TaxID=3156259 RepID=UPI003C7D4CFC